MTKEHYNILESYLYDYLEKVKIRHKGLKNEQVTEFANGFFSGVETVTGKILNFIDECMIDKNE